MLFDGALLDRARANLAAFDRRAVATEGRKAAAVALVLLPDEEGRGCFLLTKRAPTLRSHTGQWALPGGRMDAGESPARAALREHPGKRQAGHPAPHPRQPHPRPDGGSDLPDARGRQPRPPDARGSSRTARVGVAVSPPLGRDPAPARRQRSWESSTEKSRS